MPNRNISQEPGPFVLKGYDTFSHEEYDMWPIENHTYDTHAEALAGAALKWEDIKDKQPDPELRDILSIVALSGASEVFRG